MVESQAQSSRRPEQRLLLHLPATGFNNQRQSIVIGVVIASVLNRTLVLPKHLASNKHIGAVVATANLFNMEQLRTITPVVTTKGSRPIELAKGRPAIRANRQCCDVQLDDLQQVRSATQNFTSVHLLPTMGQAQAFFSSAFDARIEAVMERSIRSVFFACAASFIDRYHIVNALHFRAGDRAPMPLIQCETCNLMRNITHSSACTRPDGTAAGWADAVSCSLSHDEVRRGDGIYVATNLNTTQFESVSVPRFPTWRVDDGVEWEKLMTLLPQLGLSVVRWSDIANDAHPPSACNGLDMASGYVVSLIEQHICGLAPGHYFAHYSSSWDEYVLWLRHTREKRRSGVVGGAQVAQLTHFVNSDRLAIQMRRDDLRRRSAPDPALAVLLDAHNHEAHLNLTCSRCRGNLAGNTT